MTVVALTGGIGAGKSKAAEFFASFGARVVDADYLARMVIERGTPGFDEVVSTFGDGILKDGVIDRKALGEIVFRDADARRKLEEIIHPAVRALFASVVADLSPDEILIYEIPLLVESKAAAHFDFIVTVEADDEIRKQRLLARGLTISEIERRMASQASSAERREIANAVIENNGDQDQLLRACENLWEAEISSLK